MGLPYNMDGTEGKQAKWVRDYMQEFSQFIAIPVILWDERLTSDRASEIIKNNGRQSSTVRIDAVAAAVILQSYLDADTQKGNL